MDKFKQDLPIGPDGSALDPFDAFPAEFDALEAGENTTGRNNLDLLLDVAMPVTVEVGRTKMSLDGILNLVPGSVIALDKRAEDPVEMRVNGKLVARGEVVLVDDVYGIRITQIVGQEREA